MYIDTIARVGGLYIDTIARGWMTIYRYNSEGLEDYI